MDAAEAIILLEKVGHLPDRPSHTGLGCLVEYLLIHSISVESKLLLIRLLTE